MDSGGGNWAFLGVQLADGGGRQRGLGNAYLGRAGAHTLHVAFMLPKPVLNVLIRVMNDEGGVVCRR